MQAAKKKQGKRNRSNSLNDAQMKLVDDYFATLGKLRSLEHAFQSITDSELISACVYEINATQQRFAYLLGRLKEEEVTYLRVLR